MFLYDTKHSNWYLAFLFSLFHRCLLAAACVKNFSAIKSKVKLWFVQ